MSGDIQVKIDTKVLDRLDRETPGIADRIVRKVAYMGVEYVGSHWSPSSPSSPGGQPGIETGYLKNHIQVEPVQARQYKIVAATDYAALLEFGTVVMEARPFMMPMAKELEKALPYELKAVVRV